MTDYDSQTFVIYESADLRSFGRRSQEEELEEASAEVPLSGDKTKRMQIARCLGLMANACQAREGPLASPHASSSSFARRPAKRPTASDQVHQAAHEAGPQIADDTTHSTHVARFVRMHRECVRRGESGYRSWKKGSNGRSYSQQADWHSGRSLAELLSQNVLNRI